MKLYKITCLLLFLCFGLPGYAEYFNHLGMRDGLSQNSVMSIYQDKLGRMWFGTLEGVTVYDGDKMTAYKSWAQNYGSGGTHFLMGNDVPTIVGDNEYNLFFRADGSLIRYNIEQESFYRIRTHSINALTSYKDQIWCISNDSLYYYDSVKQQLGLKLKTGISFIRSLLITKTKTLVGSQSGLFSFDNLGNKQCLLSGVDVWTLYESSQNEIWIGCRGGGVYRMDKKGEIIRLPYLPGSPSATSSNDIRAFVEDNSGNLWFGTFDGLQKYNPLTGVFSVFKPEQRQGSLTHSSVYSLYNDAQGTIWVGTYYGGVNYFNPENDIFSHYGYNPDRADCLSFPFVGDMAEDKEGNLWICLDGGGLNCLNRNTRTFTRFLAGGKNTLPHNNLRSVCYDPVRDCLYIGTHLGGLSRYDRKSKQFYNYKDYAAGKEEYPDLIIDEIKRWKDKIIVSARNGLFLMDPNTNQFTLLYSNVFKHFDIDKEGYIWVSSGNATIHIFHIDNPKSKKEIDLKAYGANFSISKILVGGNSEVFVGTLGSGVFTMDRTLANISHYTVEESQLLSNYCYNIVQTSLNNTLITSDKGISLFDQTSGIFRSMELGMGLSISSLIEGCGAYICSNNEIYIGGTDGLTSFWEEDFDLSNQQPLFYFSTLSINDREVHANDESGILSKSLPFTEKLNLKYSQNNLRLSFAVSNYVDIIANSSYEYMLEGFDTHWIATNQTTIVYTNLTPGNYMLKVREKGNSLKTRALQEISLPVIIHAAWYNTWLAWGIYIALLSIALWWLYRVKRARHELMLSLEKERVEKLHIENLNQSKLRFFTNVSHEFRTPLTLINSQVDALLQVNALSPAIYNQILKIGKHTHQMKELISELLDFRKFDQSHVTLKLSEQNLITFIRGVYISFAEYASQHSVHYRFEVEHEALLCWLDVRQMEKVIFNLLSNAFKYTSNGGMITLKISDSEEEAFITVIDNGVGINQSEVERIFDRFYQVGNEPQSATGSPGTGIGLALTKSIVDLHHGTIHVESVMGYGSTFVVALKKGKQHFGNDKEVIYLSKPEEPTFQTSTLPDFRFVDETLDLLSNSKALDNEDYKLLVVEDNEDLCDVLMQLFSPLFQVTIAHNGVEGLEKIKAERPDIVVSDVMMPEMNGTEMCLHIKNSLDLCHIPVILLTALNTVEQNIEGLRCGADDYVTKPFNGKVLLTRCNNLIRNRRLMQSKYAKEEQSSVSLLATNPLDKIFLDSVILCINEHLDDPAFDIPFLCKEIGMSRTMLHTKFKALTNMPPYEFIMNHKLKTAAAFLLTEPQLSINEISEKLGFVSARYFSRCFKSQFEVSPMEYKKRNSLKNKVAE